MRPPLSKIVSLEPSEAACLDALRGGTDRKMLIATTVGLTLLLTQRALEKLASLELAKTDGRGRWRLTKRGREANVTLAPPRRPRGPAANGELVPEGCPARMLALLGQPRRIAELPELLNVTRQRIHQAVIVLWGRGLIRSIDTNHPVFVIARKNDPSVLLTQHQERMLSAFPEATATTISKITNATNIHVPTATMLAETLIENGLIEKAGVAGSRDLYRLTPAGLAHWQRHPDASRAEPPPLPFRSDRIFKVLSYLESQGPTRTRDVAHNLGTPPASTNALMQYPQAKERGSPSSRSSPCALRSDTRREGNAVGHEGGRSMPGA